MHPSLAEEFRIVVSPTYQEDLSVPEEFHYVWSYEVVIHNNSSHAVQLLQRQWIIADSNGFVMQVKGEGVVGKQPILPPQAAFQYASQVYLRTPSGMMFGKYDMIRLQDHLAFDVEIPAFSLDPPVNDAIKN